MARPTATLVRDDVALPLFGATGQLYKLSKPLKLGEDDPGTEFVIAWAHWVDNGPSNPPSGPQHEVELLPGRQGREHRLRADGAHDGRQ